jgi:hypothetical protein
MIDNVLIEIQSYVAGLLRDNCNLLSVRDYISSYPLIEYDGFDEQPAIDVDIVKQPLNDHDGTKPHHNIIMHIWDDHLYVVSFDHPGVTGALHQGTFYVTERYFYYVNPDCFNLVMDFVRSQIAESMALKNTTGDCQL